MAEYAYNATVFSAICQLALLSVIADKSTVWSAIGYNMRSQLIRIQGNLKSNRYIGENLEPGMMSYVQATPEAILSMTMPSHM